MGLNDAVVKGESNLEVVLALVVPNEIEAPLITLSVALNPKVVGQLVCSNVVAGCYVVSLRVNPFGIW